MEYTGDHVLVDSNPRHQVRASKYPIWVFFVIPLLALLIQVYLPLFQTLRFVSRIELSLLVTIYFALMRRSQIRGLTLGMALGLAQDSFSRFYIGMYGICKTLVGYLSASIGMQFDVEHSAVRMVLCFVFYLFHQFLYWVLQRALLDQPVIFDIRTELLYGALNAIIGTALFRLLDQLRVQE
jgi:rod shape-determining protein MreD